MPEVHRGRGRVGFEDTATRLDVAKSRLRWRAEGTPTPGTPAARLEEARARLYARMRATPSAPPMFSLHRSGRDVPEWRRLKPHAVAAILRVLGDRRWGNHDSQAKLVTKLELAGYDIYAKGTKV